MPPVFIRAAFSFRDDEVDLKSGKSDEDFLTVEFRAFAQSWLPGSLPDSLGGLDKVKLNIEFDPLRLPILASYPPPALTELSIKQ